MDLRQARNLHAPRAAIRVHVADCRSAIPASRPADTQLSRQRSHHVCEPTKKTSVAEVPILDDGGLVWLCFALVLRLFCRCSLALELGQFFVSKHMHSVGSDSASMTWLPVSAVACTTFS